MARKGKVSRKTKETSINVEVNIDGKGKYQIDTGIGFLDHMLEQFSRHSLIDLKLKADGDLHIDFHHTTEDTGIVIGEAVNAALSDRAGITRYGSALVPLDEALARVALDLSGRGYATLNLGLSGVTIADLPGDLVRHFLHSFATEARFTLHADDLAGVNGHHKAEASFKALAKALRDAVEVDQRAPQHVPSTKGTISN